MDVFAAETGEEKKEKKRVVISIWLDGTTEER